MKMNHEWTRIDTKTDGPPSTTSGTKILLQFSALGVTMSWDDGFPGARASRPHQAWHSLGHLPHLDQPGTAPWLSFGLADAVPADRVAACSIALKLSGGQRDSGRDPRARRDARAVGGGPTSQKADVPLWETPPRRAPALPCISFEEKRPIVHEDEPRMDTNRHKDKWTSFNHKRHQNVHPSMSDEAGRPARTCTASPPLGSTGKWLPSAWPMPATALQALKLSAAKGTGCRDARAGGSLRLLRPTKRPEPGPLPVHSRKNDR